MRRFAAVIAALALVALVAAPVAAAPGIKFTTHLTEDGTTVAGLGTVANPFIITTGGVPGVMRTIGATNTVSHPPLLPGNYPFYLKADAGQQAALTAYFAAKGWPQPYLDQINKEIAGNSSFFDVGYPGPASPTSIWLGDGFHNNLSCLDYGTPTQPEWCLFPGGMYALQIDDDYPVGTYTYTGVLNGQNHTHIPFTFVMTVVRV
jgi:hypothetical protein